MLAAALVALLTSPASAADAAPTPAPAAAPSAAAAPAPAKAPSASRCLPAKGAGAAPATLDALRACQDKARAAALAKARQQGRALTAAQLDAIDESQRAETRRFLAAPGVVIEGDGTAAAKTSAPATAKLGGASTQDLSKVDPKSGAAIAALQARLQASAGDGSQGITPDMAADIRATLLQQQGGVSPDMQALLDAVARDGGKLTPDTMKLLQGGAQSAKGEGLDLGIDPATEKLLLGHDFEDDKKYYPAAPASNSPPGSL
jgi:hypothetical protein